MKNQALFSSKDKNKKLKCLLLQFLFRALRVNLLYAGGLFHNYMLDKSIGRFRGVGSILSLLFYF